MMLCLLEKRYNPLGVQVIIPVTLHVPDQRAEEFYIRFGDFVAGVPNPDAPTQLQSGIVPLLGWHVFGVS